MSNFTKRMDKRDQEYAALLACYGTACECCGSSYELTLDHRDGSGRDDRIARGGGNGQWGGSNSRAMWKMAIAEQDPTKWGIMCKRCNNSKGKRPACTLDHSNGDDAQAILRFYRAARAELIRLGMEDAL